MDLHIETTVNAPAGAVWSILGQRFADIASWSSTVRSSRALSLEDVPSGWTIANDAPVPGRETTTGAGTLRESLIEYSDSERVLTFRGDGLPRVFSLATDRQAVVEINANRSRVTFDIHVEGGLFFAVLAPLLKRRMARTFGIVQDDLRILAETGQVSDAQRASVEMSS